MKKAILILLLLAVTISLVSCAKNSEVSMGNPSVEGANYGIDLMAEGVQPMSEERVNVATLYKTAEEDLEGITLFRNEESRGRTYADIKGYIGVDAGEYQYKKGFGQRVYTWYASDRENAYLRVTFSQIDSQWVLLSVASSHLSTE